LIGLRLSLRGKIPRRCSESAVTWVTPYWTIGLSVRWFLGHGFRQVGLCWIRGGSALGCALRKYAPSRQCPWTPGQRLTSRVGDQKDDPEIGPNGDCTACPGGSWQPQQKRRPLSSPWLRQEASAVPSAWAPVANRGTYGSPLAKVLGESRDQAGLTSCPALWRRECKAVLAGGRCAERLGTHTNPATVCRECAFRRPANISAALPRLPMRPTREMRGVMGRIQHASGILQSCVSHPCGTWPCLPHFSPGRGLDPPIPLGRHPWGGNCSAIRAPFIQGQARSSCVGGACPAAGDSRQDVCFEWIYGPRPMGPRQTSTA